MMRKPVIHACMTVLIAVSVLVIASVATAHDVWVTVDHTQTGRLRAMVHHGHPGDRKVPDPDKLFEFDVIGADHARRSLLPQISSVLQANIPILITAPLPISQESVLLLAAQYDNGYWVETLHGFHNTSRRQVPNAKTSLYSMKYAKALVRISPGKSDLYQTRVGHRLEVVPLNDPISAKSCEAIRVSVYFEGKPLVGADVESTDGLTSMNEKEIPRYHTDAQGIAVVPITRSGPYLLVVEHEGAPAHPELVAKDRYNATLSFTLP